MPDLLSGILPAWPWSVVGVVAVAITGGSGLVAWASTRLQREALLPGLIRPRPRGSIRAMTDGAVVIEQTGSRAIRLEGTWGLAGTGGYLRVSGGQRVDDRSASYAIDARRGVLSVGDEVEFDAIAFDPAECGFERVTIEATAGRFEALQSGGHSTAWLIGVHGQSGTPAEMLRAARVAQSEGISVLLPSYRNDPGQPATDDGFYHFGRSEWDEVDAALGYAIEHGAQHVVVAANSMGAAITGWVLRRSPRAAAIRGVFMDSPLLDLPTAVRWTASRTRVPPGIASLAMRFQRVRRGIDWPAFDVRADFAGADIPLAIVHGDRDGQVPIVLSERLAATAPHRIELLRVSGAGHCQSWNRDPERYETALRSFLRTTLALDRPAAPQPGFPQGDQARGGAGAE